MNSASDWPEETALHERLLAPIDGGCGADLRLDASPRSLYFRLRDARADARAAERAADNDEASSGETPDRWAEVETLATEALAVHTKDVEIAAWLAESLTRHRGLPGLARGLRVLAGLIGTYWSSGLHPAEDEDGPGERLSAISGLSGVDRDGSLLQSLRKVILFRREDGSDIRLWEYERARDVAAPGAASVKGPRSAEGGPSFDALEASARGVGRAGLAIIGQQVRSTLEALGELEAVMQDVATGFETPSTGRLRSLLEALARIIDRYVPQEMPVEAATDATGAEIVQPAGETSAGAHGSREELLEQILAIATIFRRSEPNSPLSLTLEEAVRRARLTMPELLRELMPDQPSRQSLLAQLGIRVPAD